MYWHSEGQACLSAPTKDISYTHLLLPTGFPVPGHYVLRVCVPYNAGKSPGPWARSPPSTVTCQEHSVLLVDISLSTFHWFILVSKRCPSLVNYSVVSLMHQLTEQHLKLSDQANGFKQRLKHMQIRDRGTLARDCSLCYRTVSGTGAPSLGPRGF